MSGNDQQGESSLQVIKLANKHNGLFVTSRRGADKGIWLKFQFDNHTGLNIFSNQLNFHTNAKVTQLGKPDSKVIEVLI